MYALITDVLGQDEFASLNVVCHMSLNMIIRDTELLQDKERAYAMHPATHLDFLIFNRISKKPLLAVEVDGYEYHQSGTKQSERDRMKDHILEVYGIPLLRFKTNGSGEKTMLVEKLNALLV